MADAGAPAAGGAPVVAQAASSPQRNRLNAAQFLPAPPPEPVAPSAGVALARRRRHQALARPATNHGARAGADAQASPRPLTQDSSLRRSGDWPQAAPRPSTSVASLPSTGRFAAGSRTTRGRLETQTAPGSRKALASAESDRNVAPAEEKEFGHTLSLHEFGSGLLRTQSGSSLKFPRNLRSLRSVARTVSPASRLVDAVFSTKLASESRDGPRSEKKPEAETPKPKKAQKVEEAALYLPNVLNHKAVVTNKVSENEGQYVQFVESLAKELDALRVKVTKREQEIARLEKVFVDVEVAPEIPVRDQLEEKFASLSKRVAEMETDADTAEFRVKELQQMEKNCKKYLEGLKTRNETVLENCAEEDRVRNLAVLEHSAAIQELDNARVKMVKEQENLAVQRVVNRLELDSTRRIEKAQRREERRNDEWLRHREETDPALLRLKREQKKVLKVQSRESTKVMEEKVVIRKAEYWQDIFARLQEVSGAETIEEAVAIFSSPDGKVERMQVQAEKAKETISKLTEENRELLAEAQEIRLVGARLTRSLDKLDGPLKERMDQVATQHALVKRVEDRIQSCLTSLHAFADSLPATFERAALVREKIDDGIANIREHYDATLEQGAKYARMRQLAHAVDEGIATESELAEAKALGEVKVGGPQLDALCDNATAAIAEALGVLEAKLGSFADAAGKSINSAINSAAPLSVPSQPLAATAAEGEEGGDEDHQLGSTVHFAGGAVPGSDDADTLGGEQRRNQHGESMSSENFAPARLPSQHGRDGISTVEDVQRIALRLRQNDPNNNRVYLAETGPSKPSTADSNRPALQPTRIRITRDPTALAASSGSTPATGSLTSVESETPIGLQENADRMRQDHKNESEKFSRASELRLLKGEPMKPSGQKVGLRGKVMQETEAQATRRTEQEKENETRGRAVDLLDPQFKRAQGGPVGHMVTGAATRAAASARGDEEKEREEALALRSALLDAAMDDDY